MPSYCPRCNAQVHGLAKDQPHLCKDIAKRLKRRQDQVFAVEHILGCYFPNIDRGTSTVIGEAIVARLANMGVTDD
jgi:hypothetical protein